MKSNGEIAPPRRAAMLFLGMGVLAQLSRDAAQSPARQAISFGTGVSMLGLATMGVAELARGFAGPGILLAGLAEAALGVLHLAVWARGRQTAQEAP